MSLEMSLVSLGVGLEQELQDEFGGDVDELDEFGGHFLVSLQEKGGAFDELGGAFDEFGLGLEKAAWR